jgi:CBS domain-containing protein
MSVKAQDLMAAAVIVTGHEETLGEVREKMSTTGISAMPVVDREGTLVGIITATDLVTDFPPALPVSRIMTRKVHTLPVDASARDAARLMREHRHHHIVLMDGDEIAGILSSFDLLRLIEKGKA